MEKGFNFEEVQNNFSHFGQYDRYLSFLTDKKGYDTQNIKDVVSRAVDNIKDGSKSFIIYGEPQSGKTEMMISLTSKLLDEGYKTIIVLITDHVPLLTQNLLRFKKSGMNPSPKNYKEIMDEDDYPSEKPLVVYCKKNSQDLKKLIEKLSDRENKIIIDDEADYATPNSKINLDEVSAICKLTGNLISSGEGIYIGVTATPARLDLNNTHKNNTSHWIEFKPHNNYVGQDTFFPIKLNKEDLDFRLTILPDDYNQDYLTEALFSFLISSAHLNLVSGNKGYSMLIHTSGKRIDHSEDKKHVMEILNRLSNPDPEASKEHYSRIWSKSKELYDGEEQAIVNYIAANINRCEPFLLNSDRDKSMDSNSIATNPVSPFTIVFGGNIASRGVTFERLLCMFFTRGVKKTFHQDTYIQRARMFGSRKDYLNHFELFIPEELYSNWHSCFVHHRLSLQSVRSNNGPPVWLYSDKIHPTGRASIDKNTVMSSSGEMGFGIFDFSAEIENSLLSNRSNSEKLEKLWQYLGDNPQAFPKFLYDYIKSDLENLNENLAFHKPSQISKWQSADTINLTRAKGFISSTSQKQEKFKGATHHFQIIYNSDTNKARLLYKPLTTKLGFLQNTRTSGGNVSSVK